MIKIFTMVKDECDIIRDWILYHGWLFGYENLFIIDNISNDGTFEIMNEYVGRGINVYRESNYKEKGYFMKKLIDGNCMGTDIAFPLDIDEFIVFHERGSKGVICDKDTINNYINNLGPVASLYKANYLYSMITRQNGYNRAVCENEWAIYSDYGSHAKSFFRVDLYNGAIDHGNHIGPGNGYFVTNICLVHFHCRNLEQMKNKVVNNVTGLGYPNDLNYLRDFISHHPNCNGNHHIKHQINILEGTYKLDSWSVEDSFINLGELNSRVALLN